MNSIDVKAELEKLKDQQNRFSFDSYFKYFGDDERVINSFFKDNRLRFTQPRELNDPLEFNPTMSFQDVARYQKYEFKGVLFPSVETFFRVQIIEREVNKYGVLSLTKIPDSFDMWSQYANGHRGFVVEFKNEFWLDNCMKSTTGKTYDVRKVDYVDSYSVALEEMVTKDKEIPVQILLDQLFFRKTSRWKHEQEYRIVRPLMDCPEYVPEDHKYAYVDRGVYRFPFTWECVSSVVLGANMTKENKTMIYDCCTQHGIQVCQAQIIRDLNDRFGKPGFVHLPLIDSDMKKVMNINPQTLCTDCISLSNRNVVTIPSIKDLPYYRGYEDVVVQFYRNSLKSEE